MFTKKELISTYIPLIYRYGNDILKLIRSLYYRDSMLKIHEGCIQIVSIIHNAIIHKDYNLILSESKREYLLTYPSKPQHSLPNGDICSEPDKGVIYNLEYDEFYIQMSFDINLNIDGIIVYKDYRETYYTPYEGDGVEKYNDWNMVPIEEYNLV